MYQHYRNLSFYPLATTLGTPGRPISLVFYLLVFEHRPPRVLSPLFQTLMAGPIAETLRPEHIDRVVGGQDSDRAALPKDSHPKENAPNEPVSSSWAQFVFSQHFMCIS